MNPSRLLNRIETTIIGGPWMIKSSFLPWTPLVHVHIPARFIQRSAQFMDANYPELPRTKKVEEPETLVMNLWNISDISTKKVINSWNIYDISMAYPWNIYGDIWLQYLWHDLVGGWQNPLKNMIKSTGMMKFPNINGKIKVMFQITNQKSNEAWNTANLSFQI